MANTVLITGTSSGIGRVTAQHFAAKGWNVCATARDTASLTAVLKTGSVLAHRLDVTDETTIATAVAAAIERFGGIDVLVNNAGCGLFGPLEGATAAQFEHLFRTNVFGAVAMIRHVLPSMRERGAGTIVNLSSLAGRFGSAFLSPYHASKYALEGLSESLRFELKPHGVRVKVVEPAHFKSDFLTRSTVWTRHPAYEPHWGNMLAWVQQSMLAAGNPEVVAQTIFRAACDTSDRLRYRAGGTAMTALWAVLPDAIWRRMLGAGMYRKPRSQPNRRTSAAPQ
jgi:NAD(P)-dependent dehydrogenase (short-subunit alcohol dehydrogenase family)